MNIAKLAFAALLGKRLPRHSGRAAVACKRPVEIRRDAWGVAYVDAQNESDAWFGLGFCHGQDRKGQLEIALRLVRGTLSSVVGVDAVGVDRATRLIGVRRAAAAQFPCFDADVQAQITAYTRGINAALETGALGARRSHEHVLLRTTASPWQPEDVIALGLLMCCLLPSNWDVELARLVVLLGDGPDAVDALDPAYPPELPVTYPPGALAGAPRDRFLVNDLARLRDFLGTSGGSNAWAVGPSRSESGRPLLASDPHLPAALPNMGYLARVRCPEFAVAGVGIVGIPAFLAGHNGHAAWGATAAQIDNTDLFLEELGPDRRSVREGDAFVRCATHTELIEVRGRAPVPVEIVTTRRGPIVARLDDPAASIFEPLPLHGRANAISFAATWLRKAPTRALLRAHTVRSFAEFRRECARSTGCAYSLIYADPRGVGWTIAAEAPRRRRGFGTLPMPGWEPDAGWHDAIIGANELPYAENPSAGFVCTANNKPVADADTRLHLGQDFLDGYRQQRLTSELGRRADWTVRRMQALQLDVRSVAWEELRPKVLALDPTDDDAAQALSLLTRWDGNVSSDSAAASVYELFLAEMCKRICQIKAPNSWQFALGKGVMKLIPGTTFNARRLGFVVRLLREQPSGFFRSWPATMLDALGASVRTLEREFGKDVEAWAWGKVRPLPIHHRFGGASPLARVFDVAHVPGYGDGGTVNQAGFEFWNPLRHSLVTAHSRTVIDVGDFGASRFVLLGGQSGNPFSPNYADLIPLWQRGEGIPIHWEQADLLQNTKNLLVLEPTPSP